MLVFLLGDHIPCRIWTTNKQTKQSRLCSVQRRPYLYGYLVLVRYVAHPISDSPILLLSGCVWVILFVAWHELQHVLGVILTLFLLQLIIVMQSLENFLSLSLQHGFYSIKWKNGCVLKRIQKLTSLYSGYNFPGGIK